MGVREAGAGPCSEEEHGEGGSIVTYMYVELIEIINTHKIEFICIIGQILTSIVCIDVLFEIYDISIQYRAIDISIPYL